MKSDLDDMLAQLGVQPTPEALAAIEGAGRAVELVPGGPLGARWLAAASDDPRLSALSEPKP